MSERKPTLLLVDDEERILRSLAMLFRGRYELLTTTDPQEALNIVKQRRIDVIVSDQRMPIMRGADLLREVKELSPNTMRLLLTGYSELDSVVASVNEGEIFRFINKPWDAQELKATVAQAADIADHLYSQEPTVRAPVSMITETGSFVAPRAGEGILVIDDDADAVEAVRDIVGPSHPVLHARSMDAATTMVSSQPVGVIVSELSVGGESVTTLLKVIKVEHPEIVTIVMTPFQDTSVLIGLINQGQVYRFLPKPIRRGPLGMNLASALRHHRSLLKAPVLRQAHVVEEIRQTEESGVAQRLRGVFQRLRGRSPAPG